MLRCRELGLADVRLDEGDLLALACGTQDVAAGSRGHDEGLGVVHLEGREGAGGALDDGGGAVNQVEHADAARGIALDGHARGDAACLEELELVEAGALLAPTVTRGDVRDRVDKLFSAP